MSEFIKAQAEVRNNLIEQVRSVLDSAETEGRGLSGEELAKINTIEADIAKADEAISVAKRSEDRKVETAEAARDFQPAQSNIEERDIFRALARGEIRSHKFESRATLVPSANTVPVGFYDEVMDRARLVGPMLETSTVITRDSGESFRMPTMTAYPTADQYPAGSAIADSAGTYSSVLLTPRKISLITKIARELVEDAGFNITEHIARVAGNAIGYKVNDLASVGTGTVEAKGLFDAAATGATAASATAFTADELITLSFSLDGAARRLPGVGWHMSTATLGAVRKLKDDAGNYLYNIVGQGEQTLLGYPIFENPAAPAATTGLKPIAFGHLPSYTIVTTGLETSVSDQAYFATDEIGYKFTYRFDGNLLDTTHVKVLEMA